MKAATHINRITPAQRLAVNLQLRVQRINVYRAAVGAAFIIAMVIALVVPVHMSDPDDWAYYYAAQNFADGQFTVDTQTHQQQVSEAQRQGGQLIQYFQIGDNKWAFEKAPGYVLYLVPFKLLGIPRGANVVLALGVVIVTYLLLKRLRDEKTAMIGCLLMLFTPLALVMLNRTYIDAYAAMAFLSMGGGLYLYYHLERHKLSPAKGGLLLFLAFFFLGWSVVSRYTNLPVAAVLGLHFIITRIIDRRRGKKIGFRSEILPLVLGIGLPTAALLLYDYFVFGSPLDYGYHYTRFPIKFAYQYLGESASALSRNGQSLPLQIILNNLKAAPRALLVGYPLLAAGIVALGVVLFFKIKAFFRKHPSPGFTLKPRIAKMGCHAGVTALPFLSRNEASGDGEEIIFRRNDEPGKWSALHTEMPWDILLVLAAWFIGVFGLYLMYEWTAGFQGGNNFVMFDRFYLPGLFPMAVICALVIGKLPGWIYLPLTLIAVAFGAVIYAQWAWGFSILPGWFSSGNFGRGFPGGGQGPGNRPGPGDGPGNMPDGFPGGSNDRLPPGFQPGGFRNNPGGYFPQPGTGGSFQPPAAR